MSDFTRVAGKLDRLIPTTKPIAMSRVVLQGESIMKREAPVKRGTLRRSITSRVERGGERGVIGTNTPYARAVNDGSKRHRITPKRPPRMVNGRMRYPALFWKGAAHPVRGVWHPGTKPNDFVGRTRTRLRPVAERELGKAYGDALAKVK